MGSLKTLGPSHGEVTNAELSARCLCILGKHRDNELSHKEMRVALNHVEEGIGRSFRDGFRDSIAELTGFNRRADWWLEYAGLIGPGAV